MDRGESRKLGFGLFGAGRIWEGGTANQASPSDSFALFGGLRQAQEKGVPTHNLG
jgi:hypothetical protein